MIKIHLLTHQRELERPTNTGQLAVKLFPRQVIRTTWCRITPDSVLEQLANKNQIALVHPSGEPLKQNTGVSGSQYSFQHYLLIDATWQEAQKIFNRTPYLKQLQVFSLCCDSPSSYQLRRNQKAQGLCTAECIIELFKTHSEIKNADKLTEQYRLFNQAKPTSG